MNDENGERQLYYYSHVPYSNNNNYKSRSHSTCQSQAVSIFSTDHAPPSLRFMCAT